MFHMRHRMQRTRSATRNKMRELPFVKERGGWLYLIFGSVHYKSGGGKWLLYPNLPPKKRR